MRTYDVERSYLADGVPDTSLLQEMRQDAMDASCKTGEWDQCREKGVQVRLISCDDHFHYLCDNCEGWDD